jgi:hypothetical protein
MALKNHNQAQLLTFWLDTFMPAKSKSKTPAPAKKQKPTKPTKATKPTPSTTPLQLVDIPPRIRLQLITSDTDKNRLQMAKLFATLKPAIQHKGDIDPWFCITLDQLVNVCAAQ